MTIHRIDPAACGQYVGAPVCAVLRDGTHFYGVIGGVEDGRLLLREAVRGPGALSVSGTTAKRKAAPAKTKAPKAETKGWGYPGYYGYPGEAAAWFALDIALIALLFTLPYFFV